MPIYQPVDRQYLLSDLKRNTVEVIFDKLNDERRKMRCTLQYTFLPNGIPPEQPENKKHIVVWDIDQHGYRTVNLDRIISMMGVNTV